MDKETVCWCGLPREAGLPCRDPECHAPIVETKYAQEAVPAYAIKPDFENVEREPIPRTCCKCGKTWKSTVENMQEWLAEKCPYCGAK